MCGSHSTITSGNDLIKEGSMEDRFFDGYGILGWIDSERYWGESWSPVEMVDCYEIVINGSKTEYKYTII